MNETKIDKLYISTPLTDKIIIEEKDLNHKKRPSWIKSKIDEKAIFVKIIHNNEAFWYRRYFKHYFFPLEKSSEDYKNYYNHIAKEYESFTPQNKKIGDFISKKLKEINISFKNKILDFGCGTGIIAKNVVRAGFENVLLLDISEKQIEIALSKKELKNKKIFIIDLTKQEIPEKYDVIVESMSLDYFKGDQLKFILNNINSSLESEGVFIMVDRHLNPQLKTIFKEIQSGEFLLETNEGNFDYFFFVGKKN